MKRFSKIACFGGLYSNYLALEVAISDARQQNVDQMYCLGDLGAFGPFPDRVFPILQENHVQCIRGNYDDSIGYEKDDCQCGYTDPRDNHFAKLSYDYTLANTSEENKAFLRELPESIRVNLGDYRVLLCHGSPRQVNEFLWESSTSDGFLRWCCHQYQTDVIVGTHSGIKWHRQLSGRQHYVNVGVLGRPENDGSTNVWYTILSVNEQGELEVEFRPVDYDYKRLASEMESENLPNEFIETVLTGWWTTCLEILPGRERVNGQY